MPLYYLRYSGISKESECFLLNSEGVTEKRTFAESKKTKSDMLVTDVW